MLLGTFAPRFVTQMPERPVSTLPLPGISVGIFFFFNDTPPPEISPLPLPAALPISGRGRAAPPLRRGRAALFGIGLTESYRKSQREARAHPQPPARAVAFANYRIERFTRRALPLIGRAHV